MPPTTGILHVAAVPFGMLPVRGIQGLPDTGFEVSHQPLGKQRVGPLAIKADAIAERRIVVQAHDGVGEIGDAGADELKPPRAALGRILRRAVGVKGLGPIEISR